MVYNFFLFFFSFFFSFSFFQVACEGRWGRAELYPSGRMSMGQICTVLSSTESVESMQRLHSC